MTAREPFETLAPEFTVKVNGQALPNEAAADLLGVMVLDDVDAAGMCTVTITAWDTAQMKPKWIDDALFRTGNPVEVALGYGDRAEPLFSGEITGLEADFAPGKPPTLSVRGYDRRHRMMRSRKTHSFTQCKDSDIASQIAGSVGLRPEVLDSGVTLPHVLQHNQTDWEFLVARGRRIGFEVMVRNDALLFRPRAFDAAEALTLHREVELMAFHAQLSTIGQVPELEVRGWDPAQKKEIVGHAGASDAGRLMSGSDSGPAETGRAFDPGLSARVMAPVQSQDEADAMARRGMAEMALSYILADGLCIGDPRLRAGTVVKIDDVGERFGGNYYLTSVEHSFRPGRGYRTAFSARRNAT